jgi:hypothetical protein
VYFYTCAWITPIASSIYDPFFNKINRAEHSWKSPATITISAGHYRSPMDQG